jgi:hypothetical protein
MSRSNFDAMNPADCSLSAISWLKNRTLLENPTANQPLLLQFDISDQQIRSKMPLTRPKKP